MRITVSIVLNSAEGRSLNSATYGVPANYNPAQIGLHAVLGKVRDSSVEVMPEKVEVAGEDVTEDVLQLYATYHKDRFHELDDQLPF